MAEKQPKKDRHRYKQLQLRIHPIFRHQLNKLVERNVSSISTEVIAALRKHLKDNDLWPPTDQDRLEAEQGDAGEE